ncbi:N-acetylglucosamine-6-phosphate deacetylase [Paenibacillus sp. 1011MAR3C5]|uniref:N-acetylglucosamine-6-phosphate deacetylase n=1 Tax=Paenibacillus sp. 1011MAR3C5 TaxID=1675787 RepID=UPI000E6BC920|nr:N-acetylglucosamine-6-phosphate deacetylase [Paenibacillus sp. 1011MAR3C5]RJE86970.1 N-acetylglucosamine-6-phosphate deacetylase [Paenibacillus sp. 1011MAR3C5]
MACKVIHNVCIPHSGNEVLPAAVWIRAGKIEKIDIGLSALPNGEYERIDGLGCLLIPGMIDVHIHGASGFDMMDGSEESIQQVSRACAATGCTAFLATSVSSSMDDLLAMIRSVKRVIGKESGARIAGLHLEGPYLNPKRKGMQNEKFLRHPDLEEMELIFREAEGLIRMVTIAPELPGGMELIAYLKEKDVVIALAHSDATYEEAKLAFEAGASHVTHCFNGMRPIHHRDPGLVVAAFEEEHVSLQAIVDGIHLHPAIVRMMHRMKGADGMVLITDALQAMGLGDGEYVFGGHQVQVVEGVARLKDGTLASSTVTMNEALRLAIEAGISLSDAVQMASATPARILGLDEIGNISTGYDADLVLLNDRFEVEWTLINGELIPER